MSQMTQKHVANTIGNTTANTEPPQRRDEYETDENKTMPYLSRINDDYKQRPNGAWSNRGNNNNRRINR